MRLAQSTPVATSEIGGGQRPTGLDAPDLKAAAANDHARAPRSGDHRDLIGRGSCGEPERSQHIVGTLCASSCSRWC
eukprot:1426340-Rhodomonas_salina.1